MKKLFSRVSVASFLVMVMLLVTTFALPCAPAQAAVPNPECWGVFVGVTKYENFGDYWDLVYADDSQREFSKVLGPVWGASHIRLLTSSQATKSAILSAIDWLANNAKANDTVLFSVTARGGDGYFQPYDATYSPSSDITSSELANAFRSVKAEKSVIILDTGNAEKFKNDMTLNGRVILMSCRSNEYGYMSTTLQCSVFINYILKAFTNFDTADTNHDYELSAEEIFQYASPLTTNYISNQHPVLDDGYSGELPLLAKFTFATETGLPSGATILTLDGVNYTSPPGTQLWIPGSSHTISVPQTVNVGSDTRFVFAGWNDASASTAKTVSKGSYTAGYNKEFLLSLTSPFGSLTGAGWYRSGSTATFSVTSSIETSDTKHFFTSWSGGYTGTAAAGSVVMNTPKSVTANWRHEYLLTFNSEFGEPTGAGWYNEGESADVSIAPEQGFLIRHIFNGWSGDLTGAQSNSKITMDGPKTITATWRTDYLQLYILIIIVLVLGGGITTTVLLMRRKRVTSPPASSSYTPPPAPPIPPAAVPPPPPPPPATR